MFKIVDDSVMDITHQTTTVDKSVPHHAIFYHNKDMNAMKCILQHSFTLLLAQFLSFGFAAFYTRIVMLCTGFS